MSNSNTLSDDIEDEDLTLEEAYNRALANRRGKNKSKNSAAKKLTGPALQAKFSPNLSASTSTYDDIAHCNKSDVKIAKDGVIETSDSCPPRLSEEDPKDVETEIKNRSRKEEAEDLTVKDLLDAPKSPIFEVRIRQAEVLRIAGNDVFKRGDFLSASLLYEKSLFHSDFDQAQVSFDFKPDHQMAIAKVRVPVFLNLCRCSQRLNEHQKAITHISKIYEEDDTTGTDTEDASGGGGSRSKEESKVEKVLVGLMAKDVSADYHKKAMFLKAKSLYFIGQFEQALNLLQRLLDKTANNETSCHHNKNNNNDNNNVHNNMDVSNKSNSINDNSSFNSSDSNDKDALSDAATLVVNSDRNSDSIDATSISAWIGRIKREDAQARLKEKAIYDGIFNNSKNDSNKGQRNSDSTTSNTASTVDKGGGGSGSGGVINPSSPSSTSSLSSSSESLWIKIVIGLSVVVVVIAVYILSRGRLLNSSSWQIYPWLDL